MYFIDIRIIDMISAILQPCLMQLVCLISPGARKAVQSRQWRVVYRVALHFMRGRSRQSFTTLPLPLSTAVPITDTARTATTTFPNPFQTELAS